MANEYTLGGPPPQSRSEKILMNQNPGPAQSRIEELLKNASSSRPTSALVYKGTVETVLSLPSSGNEVGDMYHVNSDGSEWAWTGEQWEELGKSSSVLPAITADDNGKFLRVVNGAWAAQTVPSAEGASF